MKPEPALSSVLLTVLLTALTSGLVSSLLSYFFGEDKREMKSITVFEMHIM
jgi:hypothetical protein